MALSKIPPPPLQDLKNLPFSLQEWFRQVYFVLSAFISGVVGSVAWSALSFTGSNLTDIQTRNHNDLQNIQGGSPSNYYHLTRVLEGSTTFDFPNILSITNSTTTVTISGAQTGDRVIVTPDSTLEAGLVIYGYVSAVNTITLVATNPTSAAINPASRTYYITVIKV